MTHAPAFLAGGGACGALIATRDWSRTPLGPIDTWPQSLKTATAILLRSPVPIVMLWGPDGVMLYNDAYSVFAGGRHPELLGSKVREGWPEVADFNDHVMKVGLAGGTLAYRDQELTLYRHGRPEQVWMNLDYSPVLDESGTPAGVLAIVVETTERVTAERRIRESERRLSAVLESVNEGFYALDRDWRYIVFNRACERYFNVSRDQVIGRTIWEVFPQGIGTEFEAHCRRAMEEGLSATFETPSKLRTDRFVELRIAPMDGGGVAVSLSDITERKRAEAHQRLLINELNHRVKNTLAIVQAIAQQSFRDPSIPTQARQAFEARLAALSAAHNVLTRESWEAASIHWIISDAVAPYRGRPTAFVVEGPDLALPPKTAVSLALAMHELATNAVKYGALSLPHGQVEIRWRVEDGRLRLVWRESGGPPVRPPAKRGFGSRMIERGLTAELGGTVTIEFNPEGLRCNVDAPLREALG